MNLNLLLNKEYTRWTSQQRRIVKGLLRKRDGDNCFYCRKDMKTMSSMTIEHLTPRSHGGGNFLDNLALACAKCNERRGSFNLVDYCSNVTVLELSLAEAMDYARMVATLTGKRMRVTQKKGLMLLDKSE